MFGSIKVNPGELKVKEYERYQAYYCGLCHILKQRYGRLGQILLSYDMTFLTILLTSLYEDGRRKALPKRCGLHPVKKRRFLINAYTGYAADMTVLLGFHDFQDDWIDDRDYLKYMYCLLLRKTYLKLRKKYKRQADAVELYIKQLHLAEKMESQDIDAVCALTGNLLREIFLIKEDIWKEELGRLGYYLGCYIYLYDAYQDIEEDGRNGRYNPLARYYGNTDQCREMLAYMAAMGAKSFERLPLVEETGILRNVLYSGIWTGLKL